MKPILRDAIRPLLNPAVVGTLVVMVAFGAFLAPPLSSGPSSLNLALTSSYSSGYHFTGYVFDNAGTSISGATVSLNFSLANGSGASIGSTSGVTSSDGFIRLNWSAPIGRYTVQILVTKSGGGLSIGAEVPISTANNTSAVDGVVYAVQIGQFLVVPQLLVSFENTNGSIPAGLRLLYSLNDTAPWTYLDTVTSDPQLFQVSFSNLPTNQYVYIELVSGSTVIGTFQAAASSFAPQSGATTPAGSALVTAVEDLSLFVPLAAIFVGYTAYGRERLTGALEPVQALPISRSRLFVQRMLGAITAVVLGTSVATLVFAGLFALRAGISFPSLVWFGLWGTVAAVSVIFVALAFLLAHLLRSPGTLLGTGLTIVLIGSILWGLITDLVATPLGVFRGSAVSVSAWQAWVGLLNPITVCQSIVSSAVLAASPAGAIAVIPIVSPAIVWVLGLTMWVVLPIAAGLVIATRRD
jgi:ABC-type transport system involved in multi-copper enzyme maturation permease subunit